MAQIAESTDFAGLSHRQYFQQSQRIKISRIPTKLVC